MLTENAITEMLQYLARSITQARYTANGVTYTANANANVSSHSGDVSFTFPLDAGLSGNAKITQVELLAADGSVWAARPEAMEKSISGALLYRVKFHISET